MADQIGRPIPAPPLVGREREQAVLRAALEHALAGRGSLVLIGGEAGIGKTALAEALLAEAAGRGATVLVGRCYDLSETPPYGPWTEALARAPAGDPAAPPDLVGGGLTSQTARFTAMRDYLAALTARQPVVLLLEDLHWADPASLDLLRVVARGLADGALLLLATYRADEIADDHPLAVLLPLLVREARAARLDLRPLDQGAIAALVAARYAPDEADAVRLVGYLTGRTEGNALFLGELLRTLEGAGLLHQDGARWVVGDLGVTPVPALLRQVIAGRVARLDPETARLLAIAAVIGQEVPLTLWAAVGEMAEGDLLDHAERALAARLLAETPDGLGVRFAHALIREALYAGVPPLRRRAVHRRVGERLLATQASPDPDAVAHQFRQAGDPRAAAWLVRAGERAWRAYAWLTAAARFEAALGLQEGHDADPRVRAELLFRLANLGHYTDRFLSLARLDEAVRLADAAGDAGLAAVAAFERGLLRCLVGERRRGLAELADALATLEALPAAARARLPTPAEARLGFGRDYHRWTLADQLALVGRFAEARALAEARGVPLPAQLLAWGLGQPAEARRVLAGERAASAAAGLHVQVGIDLLFEIRLVALPYEADRPGERRRLLAEAERAFARAGELQGHPARMPRNIALPLPLLEGRWDEARALALALLDAFQERRQLDARAVLGQLARARGELAEGWRQVRAALPEGSACAPGDSFFFPTLLVQRLAAELALDGGDLPAARAWLGAHDRWLAWSGAVIARAEGQLGWAAYHRAAGDPALAREHAARALALAAAPRQPLALLAAHRLLGELATADGRHAEAAADLDTALALADACAAPYERALTLLARAESRLAADDRAGARVALDEARVVLEPLGAKSALARADAVADCLGDEADAALPFGLTAREAEVLRLLADGLADAQIAARLFVSRHTVNAHTKALYGKLGVASRGAAARHAREHGLA